MPRQTATLQFGDFASLSAVHHWNSLATQLRLAKWANETVFDFDALFRDQNSLCPRAVLFERPRPSRRVEDLGELSQAISSQELIKLSGFQGELRSWHDISFANFHPTSICPVPDSFYSTESSLGAWCQGYEPPADLLSQAEDAIRFMVEECDYLEEFQICVDAMTPLGGFATNVIETSIKDEYPKSFIRTWANFANCNDFQLNQDVKNSNSLTALALTKLSHMSTELYPIMLGPSTDRTHTMFDETLHLNQANDASIFVAAAMDCLSTRQLTSTPQIWNSKLISLKLSTPEKTMVDSSPSKFNDLALMNSEIVTNWQNCNKIVRLNHSEESYPKSSLSPSDLPIYSQNPIYSGYQQQATSGYLLLDPTDNNLKNYIKENFLKPLRPVDFTELGSDHREESLQIKESLHNLLGDDE